MYPQKYFLSIVLLLCATYIVQAQDGDPKLTEVYKPVPQKINVGNIPSDAVSLFNEKTISQWLDKNGKPAQWIVKDGVFRKA